MRPHNRLGLESSPYLRQHADNPVHWWSWCDEAFAEAAVRKLPVFLSIGYSTCHWCHVMAHESFEDEATATYLNEHFVSIKLDREERPDVDQIYMQAVTALTGQGGWPLTVFLDAERRPFHGGTYFPPERKYGRPSFRDVLQAITRFWREQPADIAEQSRRLMQVFEREEAGLVESAGAVDWGECSRAILDRHQRTFDAVHGGFGAAPKFPRPAGLQSLLHHAERHPEATEAMPMVRTTLGHMVAGGIHDQLGGGFMRYSTDEHWLVPHFEKMLYDNAQLLEVLLDLLRREDDVELRAAATALLTYVRRDLLLDGGAFAAAEDADSEGHEGRFYVFRAQELDELLGSESSLAKSAFGVTESGNFEGTNILHRPVTVEALARSAGVAPEALRLRLDAARNALLTARAKRVRPLRDDKVIAAWNGLMLAAMARAGLVLDAPEWTLMARRAADFVTAHMRASDGSLLRIHCAGSARFRASLDDRAAMGLAHLALFTAAGAVEDLERAIALAEECLRFHASPESAALHFAADEPDLIARQKDSYDGALPSGNSLAALLFARLGAVLPDTDWRARALSLAGAFGTWLARAPDAMPLLVLAAVEASEPPRTLTVHGDPAHPKVRRILVNAHQSTTAGTIIIPVRDGVAHAALRALGVPLSEEIQPGGSAELCENFTCRRFESF